VDGDQIVKQAEATGQSALRLNAQFHEKLLFIKKHLESPDHPFSKILELFKTAHFNQYQSLIQKDNKILLRWAEYHNNKKQE
jgi:hypothetical protein